jgi:hypothetical protein
VQRSGCRSSQHLNDVEDDRVCLIAIEVLVPPNGLLVLARQVSLTRDSSTTEESD